MEGVREWIYENRWWVQRAILGLSRRQSEWNKQRCARLRRHQPLDQLCSQCLITRVRPPNWNQADEDRFRRRGRRRSRAKKSWPRKANLVWFVRQPCTRSHAKAEEWRLLLDWGRVKDVVAPPQLGSVNIWALLPRHDRVDDWIAFCSHYAPLTALVDILFAANLFAPHNVKPLVWLIIEYCNGSGDDSETPLFEQIFKFESPHVGYRPLCSALAGRPKPSRDTDVEIATAPGM